MKKFLAGLAPTALIGGSASAAELAVKAPYRAPPPPVWSWTGFYIRINGGGSIASNSQTFSNVSLPPFFTGPVEFSETVRRSLSGGLFGGQIGYNWQIGPSWVIGGSGLAVDEREG